MARFGMKTDHHSSLEEEPGEKGELQFRWEGGCAGGSGLCPQPTGARVEATCPKD